MFQVIQNYYGDNLELLRGKICYEVSHHGALFRKLSAESQKVKFTLFSSEFSRDYSLGDYPNGIRNENLESLTFLSNTFELITHTEVMEHVENDNAAFKEIFRVLTPGGRTIFTVPFDYKTRCTTERAVRLRSGDIYNLMTPEYHGDPFQGEKGVFTWRNYGFDLINRLNDLGFESRIETKLVSTYKRPLAVFVAVKPK